MLYFLFFRRLCLEQIKLLEDGGADEDDIINARCRYRGTSQEYSRFSKAMGIPQQRERVTVDGLGNIGVGKYTKAVAKSEKSGIIKMKFNTADDPMREVTGIGLESNPREIKCLIEDVASSKTEIEYRDGTMCYEPGLRKGIPGRIVIDPEASYSAWMHEYTH